MLCTEVCSKCGLYYYTDNIIIKPKGNITNPWIILIGETPSKEDVKNKEVFSGEIGKLLNTLIKPFGNIFYMTNAIKCYVPLKLKDISEEFNLCKNKQIRHCRYLLFKEINDISKYTTKTPILMTLGNTAFKSVMKINANYITGNIYTTNIRDEYNLEGKRFNVIPNCHPQHILKNYSKKDEFIHALDIAVKIYRKNKC